MARYSHQLALGFSVESDDPNGEDITPGMIKMAIHRRLTMPNDELPEACLPPIDTEDLEDEPDPDDMRERLEERAEMDRNDPYCE